MQMIRNVCLATALSVSALAFAADPVKISLDFEKQGHAVPETLWGVFFEDINYSGDGGVYPELIANRGFDWQIEGWKTVRNIPHLDLGGWTEDYRGGAMARVTRRYAKPVHEATPCYLRIESFGAGDGCGIRNDGFGGIAVKEGAKYDLSFYARALDSYKGGIRVVLEDNNGNELCRYEVPNSELSIAPSTNEPNKLILPDWKRYEAVFTAPRTVKDAHLSVLMDAPGIIEIEQVSLFPQDTFNGRKNGLRKDLVQMVKDLKPAVLRFPGGCITEGCDFANWYDWKLSVGDGSLESRPCNWNRWGYWQTFGLGYYEYFLLCEDVGAEPIPVVGAGVTCQFQNAQFAPMESMPYFIQNVLDLIEFANGPVDSKWGGLRAKMGHPEPFNMKYVGIGNENWDQGYLDRYKVIRTAVKEKHPGIKIISSSGPAPSDRRFHLAWSQLNPTNADLVDEHYYVTADWLLKNTRRYDSYDRNGCKVFAGEYACNRGPYNGNILYAALCEAAMMTGFERNSDVVEMTAYAPLFAKVGNTQWAVDLIHFDNTRVFGTPNYYVQKLFSTNRPTRYVPSVQTIENPDAAAKEKGGGIILRTWNTEAEFRNINIIDREDKPLGPNMNALESWTGPRNGAWSMRDGVIRQRDVRGDYSLRSGDFKWNEFSLLFEARAVNGEEGFIIGLLDNTNSKFFVNLGGWNNTKSAIQGSEEGILHESGKTIEKNRWHKVRIDLFDGKVSVNVDGEEVFSNITIPEQENPEFFSVSGVDETTDEIIVKCVNTAATHREVVIDFGSLSLPEQMAKRIILTGDKEMRNDLDNPFRCVPVEGEAKVSGTDFRDTLPPYSLVVYRFKK